MYKAVEMVPNRVYSVLIEDWDEEITGVFVSEGREWLLLLDNQNDFIVDGLRFIHKTKIDEILREENEIFKEKIFAKKYGEFPAELKYNLDSTLELVQQISKAQKLLHFDAQDEEEIVVGIIESVNEDSFHIKSFTSEADWAEIIECEFSEISTIAIQNDYLNSLSLLL